MTAVLEAPVTTSTDSAGATFSIPTGDLHNVLKSAVIFAATDPTIQAINVVHLEVTNGTLLAVATDRFRMGIVKAPVTDMVGTFSVSITVADVKRIMTATKLSVAQQRNAPVATVSLRTESVNQYRDVYRDETRVAVNANGMTVKADDVSADYAFPKWRGLIGPAKGTTSIFTGEYPPVDTRAGRARTAYGPTVLAGFTSAAWSKHDALIFEPAERPDRPTVIRIGEYFLGLIMPVRTPAGDGQDARDAWDALI